MSAGEVDGDDAVAAEVEGAMVGAEAGFVVGAEAGWLVVASVTDGRDGAPAVGSFEDDEEMVLLIGGIGEISWFAGHAAGADEDEEGLVGGDLGIDVGGGAVAEGEGLGWLVGSGFVWGDVEAFVALLVDGGEVEGAVGGDAGLPDGFAGEVDGVGEALGLAPGGAEAIDTPEVGDDAGDGLAGFGRNGEWSGGAGGLKDDVGAVG